ncbi:MAG TPA: hypothetical protein VLS94_08780 [Fusibacter sp.]|nr:hypothetical protein [Fusibacter sp.]
MKETWLVVEFTDEWFERNKGKNKDEIKQYKFMTNFDVEDKHIYEKTIQATGVDMYIKDEAYCGQNGNIKLDKHCALWVNKSIGDCSKFWKVYDAINKFYK